MTGYDRALLEAAVRTGADVTAGEVEALLRDRDQLARRANRAREILQETSYSGDHIPDPGGMRRRAVGALDGEIR